MSKLFVRAALIGCAAAGAAVAQTAPVPTPIAVPAQPVPTQPVVVRVTSPAPGQTMLKTFDIADLVAPPADTPLAKPGTDRAMIAAAKVYTQTRAFEVLDAARKQTPESVCGFGGLDAVEMTSDNKTLVVRNTPAVVDRVGACLESMRKLRSAHVKVDLVVIKVPSKNEAMAKLLGEKGHAAVSADEFNVMLRELKAAGAADILSRPTLMVHNKQTGFCQVGSQVPVPMPGGTVTYQPVGLTTRVTPELSADLKSVALALEFVHSEVCSGPLTVIDSQQMKSNLVLPDGGTMAVKVSTLKEERKTESKVPVIGDLPYMGQLFHTVSTTREPVDTVAIITATRVNERDVMMPPAAPPMVAPTVTLTPTVARLAPLTPPMMPAPVVLPPTAVPYTTPVVMPQTIRVVGIEGLERVGINFNTLTTPAVAPVVSGMRFEAQPGANLQMFPTPAVAPVTASRPMETCDSTCSLMTAYKAACAAGNKDEATRLALQLLAKDPTCFGKK